MAVVILHSDSSRKSARELLSVSLFCFPFPPTIASRVGLEIGLRLVLGEGLAQDEWSGSGDITLFVFSSHLRDLFLSFSCLSAVCLYCVCLAVPFLLPVTKISVLTLRVSTSRLRNVARLLYGFCARVRPRLWLEWLLIV